MCLAILEVQWKVLVTEYSFMDVNVTLLIHVNLCQLLD